VIPGTLQDDAAAVDARFPAGLEPGSVIGGKFRVEGVLGAGGMGVVLAAHHLQLDEPVALKVLLPDVLRRPDAVARFEREARAAAKIRSEHVVRVMDVGQLEDGSPFMVMERLEGVDLAGWLAGTGALPASQAIDLLLEACEAIAEAHSVGIVHRDLKPANLFCERRRDGTTRVKVLDFGISKHTEGGAAAHVGMTNTAAVLGSPLYMSPEQMRSSKVVDARSDIWSLGVVLFELLSGRVPYEATTLTELAFTIATTAAPPLRTVRPDLPERLEAVVARCLEREKEARFASVSELARALAEFGSEASRRSVERIVGVQALASAAPPDRSSIPVTPSNPAIAGTVTATGPTILVGASETPKPRRSRAALAIGASALGAAFVAVILARGALGPAASTAPSGPAAPSSSVAASAPSPAPSTATAGPSMPPSTSAAAQAPPASSTPPPPAASAPALPAPAGRSTPPHPVVASPASPATTPHPRQAPQGSQPSAACDPPYSIDEAGRKHFKPECYQ